MAQPPLGPPPPPLAGASASAADRAARARAAARRAAARSAARRRAVSRRRSARGERRGAGGAQAVERGPAARGGGAHPGERVAAHAQRGHEPGLLALAPGQAPRLAAGVVAGAADRGDDLLVVLLDAAQELRALEQVGEAVRAQHDGDHVEARRLVAGDEPLGEHAARLVEAGAQAGQPRALGPQRRAHGGEAGAVAVEVGLHLRLPALEHGDLAGDARDELPEPADVAP
jgi:hypothetical protein